jgi:hypothetical protein
MGFYERQGLIRCNSGRITIVRRDDLMRRLY